MQYKLTRKSQCKPCRYTGSHEGDERLAGKLKELQSQLLMNREEEAFDQVTAEEAKVRFLPVVIRVHQQRTTETVTEEGNTLGKLMKCRLYSKNCCLSMKALRAACGRAPCRAAVYFGEQLRQGHQLCWNRGLGLKISLS